MADLIEHLVEVRRILKAQGLRAAGDTITDAIAEIEALRARDVGANEGRLKAENAQLREALRWYVENDDVNFNDPDNQFWIDGYNKALVALGPPQPAQNVG